MELGRASAWDWSQHLRHWKPSYTHAPRAVQHCSHYQTSRGTHRYELQESPRHHELPAHGRCGNSGCRIFGACLVLWSHLMMWWEKMHERGHAALPADATANAATATLCRICAHHPHRPHPTPALALLHPPHPPTSPPRPTLDGQRDGQGHFSRIPNRVLKAEPACAAPGPHHQCRCLLLRACLQSQLSMLKLWVKV